MITATRSFGVFIHRLGCLLSELGKENGSNVALDLPGGGVSAEEMGRTALGSGSELAELCVYSVWSALPRTGGAPVFTGVIGVCLSTPEPPTLSAPLLSSWMSCV